MADVNVNVPAEQAPAMAPPTRTDEQILPRIRWVPIGKSNCYLDAEWSQSNPIYKIAVNHLKQTNFFRAFTASSTIPASYIQQFWDTICYDRITGDYKCQLNEQWFDLTKDILRDSLQITPVNNNKAFSSPSTPDTLIQFVNDLGYPKEVRLLDLKGKSSSVADPLGYKKNLAQQTQGKKKATLIVIPSVKFTKLIIFHLQCKHNFHLRPESPLHLPTEEPVLGYLKFSAKGTKREVFGMTIPNDLITDDIRGAQYYDAFLEKVAKHQRYLASEEVSDPDSPTPKPAKPTKPKVTKQAKPVAPKATTKKPKPTPAKPQDKKRKPVSETSEALPPAKRPKMRKGIPLTEPGFGDLEADTQRAIKESLKDAHGTPRGPLPPVVFRETDPGKLQPLPEVQGKGKEKVDEEQAAQVLLNPQTLKKKSSAEYDTESDEEVPPVVKSGAQDKGQARPNPGKQDEGQAGPNPGNDTIQPQPERMDEGFTATVYPNVQENLKLTADEAVIPEEPASSTGTLSSLQHLAKDFSFGDQFFNDKPSEADNEKTTTDTEAESMVSVTIYQDTSAIPPMTSPVIDLVSRPDSPNHIGELKQHITDLVDANQALEERLDKHGSRVYKLENQDIPNQVRKAVDEIVTDAVDWAMQAPLRECFKDLPEANMKEILHNRIWESKSYQTHEDHMMLYEALEKSMARDNNDQILSDLAEARKMKKKRQVSPKTPPGSPPHPPPPHLPLAGPSGTSRASGASGSSPSPPPPPPPSNTQGDQSTSTATPSSLKTTALVEYRAFTMTDTRIKPFVSSIPKELHMDDDTIADEQAYSSGAEDIGHDHIPTVNLRQSWWKPLTEDRPATPEPTWTIPSSDLTVPTNNWASALKSTYAPPPENSLLAQIGDMATFMDWYCKKQGISELTQKDLEGPAYEIVKVFHPDVIHLQFQMEECHWYGYLRKGQKTKPKRQNRTRNGKAGKRQSQSPSPSVEKST
ncbi:hypothetical protein Tco_0896374 [Tanacetum coccineum]